MTITIFALLGRSNSQEDVTTTEHGESTTYPASVLVESEIETVPASTVTRRAIVYEQEPIIVATCYTTEYLNVREYGSMEAPIVATLPKYSPVDIVLYGGDWTRIVYEGEVAYVATAYLTDEEPHPEPEEIIPLWGVVNESQELVVPQPGLQEYLYKKLCEYDMEWFMKYAVAQAWQESRWNPEDKTDAGNGVYDCGLFQFRNIHWAGLSARYLGYVGDIFNPYTQIDVYTARNAAWFAHGYSLEQVVSYHFTNVYIGSIDHWYLYDHENGIMTWANRTTQVR